MHGGERRLCVVQATSESRSRQKTRDWQVAMKPGQRRKLAPDSWEALAEQVKASLRAKVEHSFLDMKQIFGYAKLRYRGLAKNRERLALLLGLSNLKRFHDFPAG